MNGAVHTILDPGDVEGRLLPILESGGEVPLRVTGTSMVPFLRDRRDLVYLRGPAFCPPRTGDILFFRRQDGTWVLHRLFRPLSDGRLLINGDAQTWFETIDPDQIAGVVVRLRRDGGPVRPARRRSALALWHLWRRLLPIRPQLLRLLGRAGRLRRRFSGKCNISHPPK